MTDILEAPRARKNPWRRRGVVAAALTTLITCSFVSSGATALAAMPMPLLPLPSPTATATATPLVPLPDVIGFGVTPVATTTAPLAPGQSSWVSVSWQAPTTVVDWSTTVTAPAGVSVSYPTTRGGADTSLYGSAVLAAGMRDYAAFKVKVPYTQTTNFSVTLTSTYWGCTGLTTCVTALLTGDRASWLLAGAKQVTLTTTVTVPVVPATGAPFTQNTTRLTAGTSGGPFQQVSFTGGQTDLAGFTVRAGTLPPGLEVSYPSDGTVATLNGGSALGGGTTDYVGMRFTANGIAPGTYTVPLVITYTAAAPVTTTGAVTVVVA
jgi:hypothetical protein